MESKGTILITGGSGLVGSKLTQTLHSEGYKVRHLSTSVSPLRADESPKRKGEVEVYGWDPAAGSIDNKALEGVDYLINLAGASIAKRWTADYKRLIRSSRVDSLQVLYNALEHGDHKIKALISSSAVGYYPSTTDGLYSEDDGPGNDFLGSVCVEWEEEARRFEDLGLRVSMLRTGIVLANEGGALPVIAKTVNWFVGAPLGSGKQVMPWVHLTDLCRMYVHAIEHDLSGPYNAVGLKGATNSEMTHAVARALRRPVWPFKVPAFVLRAVLGEQAQLVLMSSPCSPELIVQSGFNYRFTDLDVALIDLLV